MTEFCIIFCYLLIAVSIVIGFCRLIKGPDTLNRILAFDLICICIIAITVIYSISQNTTYYVSMILLFCLLGFTSMVGFMDVLFRKQIKEKNDQ